MMVATIAGEETLGHEKPTFYSPKTATKMGTLSHI